MGKYILINPDKEILTIEAPDQWQAIQQAKKTDNYKFSESEYTIKKKYTISNLDNEKYKNYSVRLRNL